MQARLFSVPIAAMLASTIRTSRASMISPQGDVGGVVEEPPQRRHPGQPGDLVARRVEPLSDARGGHAEVLGQLGAEELGGLVEIGPFGARRRDLATEVVPARSQ